MKRVRPGEYFAIEGLWMTNEEAALVKQELLARRIKQAERLAQAIGFPSREWQSGSSFDESYPVNAAALREAIGKIRAELHNNTIIVRKLKYELFCLADTALATPPRNCDVGSLAEQRQRFLAYCEKMQHTDKACCGGCPIVKLRMDGTIGTSCELAWAQMPKGSEAEQ